MKKGKNCCTANRISNAGLRDSNVEAGTTSTTTEDMVNLPGGTFLMGTDTNEGFPEDGEGPVRETTVDAFWMDETTVTNAQFAKFIQETDYKTDAERYGWSFVFKNALSDKLQKQDLPSPDDTPWWRGVKGAYWKRPEGPDSNISARMDHPVVHISWNDAVAYCQWSGKRLPTEAEWEYAARGGLKQKKFPWGDELTPNGKHHCNIWQGDFPEHNTKDDGYAGTAPAKSFEPNDYGLYNSSGNIWEWMQDWFSANYSLLCIKDNPTGPGQGSAKVIRGGSYLCHKSYCNRYRLAARSGNTPDSSTGNMGFRCAKDI